MHCADLQRRSSLYKCHNALWSDSNSMLTPWNETYTSHNWWHTNHIFSIRLESKTLVESLGPVSTPIIEANWGHSQKKKKNFSKIVNDDWKAKKSHWQKLEFISMLTNMTNEVTSYSSPRSSKVILLSAQSGQHYFESLEVRVQGVSPLTRPPLLSSPSRDFDHNAKQQMMKGLMYGHRKISRKLR